MTRRDFSIAALGAVPFARELGAASLGDGGALLAYVLEYAKLLEDYRRSQFEKLQTAEDIDALRSRVRTKLAAMWGPFPEEPGPLDAQPFGTVERPGFTVEKLVFESRPGLFVPANLYRPAENGDKLPAVVVVSEHPEGKTSDLAQRTCSLLARHGLIAFSYDTLGVGERPQFDSGSASEQKRALGRQCTALGLNLMSYRAWDCRRALDYLEQREDVDSSKLAVAGSAAEALQYAAFDDRVSAAFPSGQVVSFHAFIEAIRISDPERVLYGSLREGVEHSELLACLAPKPLVVGAPRRGLVSVEAAKRTFDEALGAYRAVGKADVASFVDANEASALGPDIRRAGADWLSRWLSPVSRTVREEFTQLIPAEDLLCGGPDGFATKTVVDLNRELAARAKTLPEVPAEQSRFEVYKHGIRQRIKDVTRVGKFRPERGIEVSDRTIDAGSYARGVAVVVSDYGKDDPWLRRAVIDPIVASQYSVVALDLRGWGAGAPARSDDDFDWENFFADAALQLGRPLLGQRMRDLLAVPATTIGRLKWTLVGVGDGALVAAHAAAIDDRVERLITVNGLLTFQHAIDDPFTEHPMSSFPPGVLQNYDVRDIYASAAPRPVLALNPTDSKANPIDEVRAWEHLDWVSQVYETIGAPDTFQMRSSLDSVGIRESIAGWLSA